jgi:Cu/Zn superoxide dismutase
MDNATKRRIIKEDNARRDARDIADYLVLHKRPEPHKRHAMLVRADARAIGAVTALGAPQRVKPRTTADSFADSAGVVIHVQGACKVTHADGSVTFVPASAFRNARKSRNHRTITAAPKAPEAASIKLAHDFNEG